MGYSNFEVQPGERFGSWEVLDVGGRDGGRNIMADVECACGARSTVRVSRLQRDESTMCRSCAGKARHGLPVPQRQDTYRPAPRAERMEILRRLIRKAETDQEHARDPLLSHWKWKLQLLEEIEASHDG